MTGLRRSLLVISAVAILTACGASPTLPTPAGTPSARGTLFSEEPLDPTGADAMVLFTLLVDTNEYPYFENARLSFDFDTVITTETGDDIGLRDLESGMVVDVWTGVCRESFPVQCDVTRVHVLRAD